VTCFIRARFTGARIQCVVVDGERKRQQRTPGTPAVHPVRRPRIIDAEGQVAIIGQTGGHRIRLQTQLKAATRRGIVLTQQISRHIIQLRIDLQPQRQTEVV